MKCYKFHLGLNSTWDKFSGMQPEMMQSLIKTKAIAVIAASFDSFSVIEVGGYWQGKPEPSLIIELIEDANMVNAHAICVSLAYVCGQDSVICTETDVILHTS